MSSPPLASSRFLFSSSFFLSFPLVSSPVLLFPLASSRFLFSSSRFLSLPLISSSPPLVSSSLPLPSSRFLFSSSCLLLSPLSSSCLLSLLLASSPFLLLPLSVLSPPQPLQFRLELFDSLLLPRDGLLHFLHFAVLLGAVAGAHSVHALLHASFFAEAVFEQ